MTPDNGVYYHVAYVVAAVVYVSYAISLAVRRRNLEARLEKLSAGDRG